MLTLLLLLLLFPFQISAATLPLDSCYACHNTYKDVRHGKASCTDCHRDVDGLPHKKLEKPNCARCHTEIPRIQDKSIHAARGLECTDCHNTHNVSAGAKTCQECHKNVKHTKLPSSKAHLTALNCIVCHGNVEKSSIEVTEHRKDGKPISASTIDPDGDKILDQQEWANFTKLLKSNGTETDVKYTARANVHGVRKKATSCNECHGDGRLFNRASIKMSGAPLVNIRVKSGVFIPDLPSIDQFAKTVHGRNGVNCSDCHTSKADIGDQVCVGCHKKTYETYKSTVHASSGATVCTDCHNPHSIPGYSQLNAHQRVEVCARCHNDYLKTHTWLPNTELHFNYLECSTCHSPKSTKSIVFSISCREENQKKALFCPDIKNVFSEAKNISSLIDKNGNRVVESQELSEFLVALRRRTNKELFLGTSLVVTKAFHDYSSVSSKEKVCSACHSAEAPFYESMYLSIPEETRTIYLPVKGTGLSELPAELFIDLSLIGEEKIKNTDIQKVLGLRGQERSSFIQQLGWKWIDFFGISLIGLIILGIIIHIAGRIISKR